MAPLDVADGLVLHSSLLARRQCHVSEYPGSNSGKARGAPIQLARNSRKERGGPGRDKDGAAVTYLNIAYLDALMSYFELPSVCAPSDKAVWKEVQSWPLVPARKGGRLTSGLP